MQKQRLPQQILPSGQIGVVLTGAAVASRAGATEGVVVAELVCIAPSSVNAKPAPQASARLRSDDDTR